MTFVLGPWASRGCPGNHAAAEIAAPAGLAMSDRSGCWPGDQHRCPVGHDEAGQLAIVRLLCAGRTGALFTSVTVTAKAIVALDGGCHYPVTRVVNV